MLAEVDALNREETVHFLSPGIPDRTVSYDTRINFNGSPMKIFKVDGEVLGVKILL